MEVIEGTWEEIKLHEDEFKGHKLRVFILPEEDESDKAMYEEQKRAAGSAKKLITYMAKDFDAPLEDF